MRFVPAPDEIGQRIDAVVTRRTGAARAAVQRALRDGRIVAGGRAVKPSHRLAEDEVIEGDVPAEEESAPRPEEIPVAVRYSDERVLVVSKPAGLVTHPAHGHRSGTLVNALLALGGPVAPGEPTRAGIVHRLDKDTSGLLLVARDDSAHAFLVDQMKARRIARTYLAVVRGRPPSEAGAIDAAIGRHPTHRRKMAVVAGGRRAVTHYRTVATASGAALVEVNLETGRTHQIRVHLAYLGCPVLGDRTYGGWNELSVRLGLTRPFLHAWRLRFPHPDGDRDVDVRDPLPDDLAQALAAAGIPRPAG